MRKTEENHRSILHIFSNFANGLFQHSPIRYAFVMPHTEIGMNLQKMQRPI